MKDIFENGQGYDGNKNVDWEGRKCISWEKHKVTYQRHYHEKTARPVCRNFHIDGPVVFCLVNKGRKVELSPCNVPLCPKQENFDVWAFSDLGESKPSKCIFPFKRLGKYFSKVSSNNIGRKFFILPIQCIEIDNKENQCYAGRKRNGIQLYDSCLPNFAGIWSSWSSYSCSGGLYKLFIG